MLDGCLVEKFGPILVSENPLPNNPSKFEILKDSLRCPPHGKVGRIFTLLFLVLALWAACLGKLKFENILRNFCKLFISIGMFGKIATPPNGTVFILIILVVLALFFGNHYSICTEDIVDL